MGRRGSKFYFSSCATLACADDVVVASSKPEPLQSLVSTSEDYGSMERYEFQLVKSVVLKVNPAENDEDYVWLLNGDPMPVVTESMHVGILRSASTQVTAVQENVKKARRTLYSLMPSGCHGHNGLYNTLISNICSPDSYLWNGSGSSPWKAS